MFVLRLLVVVGIAILFYLVGTRAGRARYPELREKARKVWNAPELKKAHSQVQKLAKRNAKKISKAVHH